jgi:hypothetical protein
MSDFVSNWTKLVHGLWIGETTAQRIDRLTKTALFDEATGEPVNDDALEIVRLNGEMP